MIVLDAAAVQRRFLVLRLTRWLPTGLLIPILILFLLDRGLSLAQVGIGTAVMGGIVLLLELPTGGLADALGRRRVLIMANLFELVSLAILLSSRSFAWIVVAFAIQGIFRALESGPLDSWYVDAARDADPEVDVERGLSRGGVVLGLAVAAGSILSSALVWWHPLPMIEPLAVPFIAALVLRLVDTALVAGLMSEIRPPIGLHALRDSLREVPVIIKGALGLVMASTALSSLVAVELFWGFGMASWENLFPARLETVLGSGDSAAELLGPVAAAAWMVSAAGAAIVPWFSRRAGRHVAAAWMRVLQAATVVGMGAMAGVAGMVVAYLLCYVIHGAANPVHIALVHEQAESANRTTVVSLNSMAAMASGAVGGVVLGVIADAAGITAGMYVGAAVLAAAAPLYLMARKRQRSTEVIRA